MFGATSGDVKKHSDVDIASLGKLADFTAKGGRLVKLPGIGPAGANRISDAIAAYWRKHPPAESVAAAFCSQPLAPPNA